ncbi:MAG: hypothetical protein R8F63_11740 [Acidimicrobiales bacterium]|nr:hypothetical protein [Acidimicrobiales bacterium]
MTDTPTPTPASAATPPAFRSGSNLDQLMPVLLFLFFYNVVDIKAAVVASTLWSIKAAIGRRRRGLDIGYWLPGVAVYLILRSVVTILVDEDIVDFGISSEAVYFGIGFVTKILVGVVLAITVFAGRPFLAWAVPKVLPLEPALVADPRYRRTMSTATMFIVVFEIVSAVWDIWLYNNSGINLFLVTRFGVNFTVGFIAITGGLMYIDRKLDPIESYPGLVHLIEGTARVEET